MANNEVQVEIGILKIRDLGFVINESINPDEESQLNYNLNLNYNIEEEWVEFTIGAEFKNNSGVYLSGRVLTRFFVRDIKKFEHPQGIDLPPEVMTTMFSMSFTHTRAILAKNISGSEFGEIYLPIIKPNELLNQFLNPSEK